VRPAFLELAEPSIPDAIDGAVADGATTVVVVPYFLHPGRHQREDVPAIVEAARLRHPEVDLRLLDLFGADPALVDVLEAQVSASLGPGRA
ncbi:MAG: CbiX/SirB N-terminal domain-containing protein, partial [Aquihabitans sp.]